MRYINYNHDKGVRAITRKALTTRSERKKLELLTSLFGVSVPMASAILMLTNPKRYGVIDIRVWQLLHKLGSVSTTPSGTGFGFKQWYQFLVLIRYFGRRLNVSARDVERTLLMTHMRYQKGRLYQR